MCSELTDYLPFMFFIEDFVRSLYGRVYNIEIFLLNNLLILIYFAFHYYGFIKTINKHKTDIVYKKYKGIIILHIVINYIVSVSLCFWFTSIIHYEDDILWNILFSPFIASTVSTAFDSRILRNIEKKIYDDLREKEYKKYKESLIKIVEAQEIQQRILGIHNKELGELKKNICIVEKMMHVDDEESENEDEKVNKEKIVAQGRDNLP